MRIVFERADGSVGVAICDPVVNTPTELIASLAGRRHLVNPAMPAGWQDYISALRVDWSAKSVTLDAATVTAIDNARADADVQASRALRAVVIWLAGKVGVTPAQARAEIIAIYKQLG